jgi:hypothetical protein
MPLTAYIDPGSGSMLLQVLLASVLAVPFFFRRAIAEGWHRIRGDRTVAQPVKGGEDTTDHRG